MAKIKVHQKSINLGHFDNVEDAASAYRVKAKEVFGEFAHGASIEEISHAVTGNADGSASEPIGALVARLRGAET